MEKIERRGLQRKYKVSEDYFDNIDTEEKAYWLGFITSDGYVTDRHLRIRLSVKDENHLWLFKKSINSEHPIRYIEAEKSCEIIIGSNRIVKSLNNLGVVRAKSLICVPPYIQNSLVSHYWRGVFDGDGCIGIYGNKPKVNLLGSEQIINKFIQDIPISLNKFKRGNYFTVTCTNIEDCKILLKYLYENSSIYLNRKYNKYKEVLMMELKRKNHKIFTKEELEETYENSGGSWKKAADYLGIGETTIHSKRKLIGMI